MSNTDSIKSSTIRLKQKTKNLLDQQAKGKETHDEIVLRLIKLANNLNSEKNTIIQQKGNIIGTKYETTHKTLHLSFNDKEYDVVCHYNDLSILSILRNKSLQQLSHNHEIEWRLDLEIVNVNKGSGWKDPKTLSEKEATLLYLISVKRVLEETFDITLYQFSDLIDYSNIDNWIEAYEEYQLSRDSLNTDIRRRLH